MLKKIKRSCPVQTGAISGVFTVVIFFPFLLSSPSGLSKLLVRLPQRISSTFDLWLPCDAAVAAIENIRSKAELLSRLLVLVLALLVPKPSYGAEDALAAQDNPWLWLEEGRVKVSRNVTAFGRNLDAWLAGEGSSDFSNKTFLKIRLNQQLGSIDGYHSRARIEGSLDLPRASERWKLIFESESRELNSLEDSALGEQPSGDSFAGFQFLQKAGDRLNLSHGIGLRGGDPIDPYYRLKASYEKQLSDAWGFGIRQRVFHYDSVGWGYNTKVTFRRPLSVDQVLLVSSDVQFLQSRGQVEFGQTVSLHKSLSDQRTMSYEAGVLGRSKPNQKIDLYYAGAQYRRAIRGDWLFLEVIPQVLVERADSWRPQARLSINLEMLFSDI